MMGVVLCQRIKVLYSTVHSKDIAMHRSETEEEFKDR